MTNRTDVMMHCKQITLTMSDIKLMSKLSNIVWQNEILKNKLKLKIFLNYKQELQLFLSVVQKTMRFFIFLIKKIIQLIK